MTATRGQRLRAARAKHFRSARAAAVALGLPISSYSAHERAEAGGGRDFGPDEARRYARYFRVTPEWLLTGYDGAHAPTVSHQKLKIIGYVGAHATVHPYNVSNEQFEHVDVDLHTEASSVALDIRDHRLAPLLPKGWIVVYDDERRSPTAGLIGSLCVVSDRDDRIFVRVLSRLERGIRWAALVRAIVPRQR